jgi:prepilin-type N-terminal cleavage/methylation domain-containing protein
MTARSAERGFSLIELMVVMMIMSLLIRIALPSYANIRRDAIVARALGDYDAIRAAAASEFAATGSYAPDAKAGVVPKAMKPYLPRKYSFKPAAYTLDWNNNTVADPSQGPGGVGQILSVTFTAKDKRLGLQILNKLGKNCTHWSVGNAHTFVVQSTLESPR